MVSHLDRERGILSRADRAYLLGEADIGEKTQQERNTRARIRDRVTNSVLDFGLVNIHLDERDRQMIADNLPKMFAEFGEPYVLDRAADECLVPMLAFTYALSLDLGVDFTIPLERAVRDVEMGVGQRAVADADRLRDVDVRFDVDRRRLKAGPEIELTKARFEAGEDLTDGELGLLVRSGRLNPEELRKISGGDSDE